MQDKARSAANKLKRAIGQSVSLCFGFPDAVKGDPEWFLTVYTDDEGFTCPDLFDGLKVRKRNIPRAQ